MNLYTSPRKKQHTHTILWWDQESEKRRERERDDHEKGDLNTIQFEWWRWWWRQWSKNISTERPLMVPVRKVLGVNRRAVINQRANSRRDLSHDETIYGRLPLGCIQRSFWTILFTTVRIVRSEVCGKHDARWTTENISIGFFFSFVVR